MLDRCLPNYLATNQTINGEALTLPAMVGSRIYRVRAPQGATLPYIIVGSGHDIDFGQTADRDLKREVGSFNVLVCGLPTGGYADLDRIVDVVIKYLKAVRNRFIPSALVTPRMWVQCILVEDRIAFESVPKDATEQLYIGYQIPIRSGYDQPITS